MVDLDMVFLKMKIPLLTFLCLQLSEKSKGKVECTSFTNISQPRYFALQCLTKRLKRLDSHVTDN